MTENCNDCKYEKECNHTGKYDYTYDKIMDYQTNKEYNSLKDICDLLNEQDERIETLKEDVEIILDYVLNKGKFAMTVKEQKAHNRLRGFVRGDME